MFTKDIQNYKATIWNILQSNYKCSNEPNCFHLLDSNLTDIQTLNGQVFYNENKSKYIAEIGMCFNGKFSNTTLTECMLNVILTRSSQILSLREQHILQYYIQIVIPNIYQLVVSQSSTYSKSCTQTVINTLQNSTSLNCKIPDEVCNCTQQLSYYYTQVYTLFSNIQNYLLQFLVSFQNLNDWLVSEVSAFTSKTHDLNIKNSSVIIKLSQQDTLFGKSIKDNYIDNKYKSAQEITQEYSEEQTKTINVFIENINTSLNTFLKNITCDKTKIIAYQTEVSKDIAEITVCYQ